MSQLQTTEQLLQAATRHHQANQFAQAERLYRQILQRAPQHPETHHRLGLLYSQQQHYAEAVRFFTSATTLDATNPTYHYNLGEAQRRLGHLTQAAQSFQQAATLAPDFTEAHHSLANTLKALDHIPEAIERYKRVLQLDPGHARAFYNLGNTFLSIGQFRSALSCYQAAVALQPDYAEAYNNLGVAHKELDETDAALEHFRHALALAPERTDSLRNLAQTLEKQGQLAAAREAYTALLAQRPADGFLRLYLATLAPVIPADNAAIAAEWDTLHAALAFARQHPPALDAEALQGLDAIPPSHTVYHGRDERAFKAEWARLFDGRIAPPTLSRPTRTRPHAKPHLGFVVTHGHEGVFLKCMRGILNHLSGDQFRITVLCSRQAGPQILQPAINNPAVQFLPLAPHLPQLVEQVRQAEFDVLHYWEVGTDSTNYFLPFFALAPVQCATWGWPITSGIPQMHYFLSCALLETPESDQCFTEKLVRLQHLPTYYYRPAPALPLKTRTHFGFTPHEHLYLCQQNLRKVQPDFDALLGPLLRDDPLGTVLFIQDAQPALTELLRTRFAQTLPDVAARIRFMPRLPEPEYLALIALSDVVLDTLHYGGGANTTYDALSMGTPIVTLPGRFHRGRWAYAAYQRLGLSAGIADSLPDYVARAHHLASDPTYRAEISAAITATCPILFEQLPAVHELADFFLNALSLST